MKWILLGLIFGCIKLVIKNIRLERAAEEEESYSEEFQYFEREWDDF